MFSIGDGTRFWLYTKPTDMRKNFNMLSGIVNNDMRQNLYSGDVFVFVNASNNMMKLLRYEPGGLVIYNKRLDHRRMHLVEQEKAVVHVAAHDRKVRKFFDARGENARLADEATTYFLVCLLSTGCLSPHRIMMPLRLISPISRTSDSFARPI